MVTWRASRIPFAAILAAKPTEAELESQAVSTTVTASPGKPNTNIKGPKISPTIFITPKIRRTSATA